MWNTQTEVCGYTSKNKGCSRKLQLAFFHNRSSGFGITHPASLRSAPLSRGEVFPFASKKSGEVFPFASKKSPLESNVINLSVEEPKRPSCIDAVSGFVHTFSRVALAWTHPFFLKLMTLLLRGVPRSEAGCVMRHSGELKRGEPRQPCPSKGCDPCRVFFNSPVTSQFHVLRTMPIK